MWAKAGVYKIHNIVNGKVYVGSTVSFYNRWRKHKNELRKGIHGNQKLQRAWNKHGENSFKFEIIGEIFNDNFLINAEQKYLDKLRPAYNICSVAGSRLGSKHTKKAIENMRLAQKGHAVSDETRLKLKLAQEGKKHSRETILKMCASRKNITTETRQKLSIAQSEVLRRKSKKEQVNFG